MESSQDKLMFLRMYNVQFCLRNGKCARQTTEMHVATMCALTEKLSEIMNVVTLKK